MDIDFRIFYYAYKGTMIRIDFPVRNMQEKTDDLVSGTQNIRFYPVSCYGPEQRNRPVLSTAIFPVLSRKSVGHTGTCYKLRCIGCDDVFKKRSEKIQFVKRVIQLEPFPYGDQDRGISK